MKKLYCVIRRPSSGGGEGWGSVQGVPTPALFLYNPNYALKFLDQFRRNALKIKSKKTKETIKTTYQQHSLIPTVFQHYFKKDKRGSHQ